MARYLDSPTKLKDLYDSMMAASDNAHADEKAAHEKLHDENVEHDEDNFGSFNPSSCYVCALANDFSGGDPELESSEGAALTEVVKTVMTNAVGPAGLMLSLHLAPALALFISLGYLAGRDAEKAGLPDPRNEVAPVIEASVGAGSDILPGPTGEATAA